MGGGGVGRIEGVDSGATLVKVGVLILLRHLSRVNGTGLKMYFSRNNNVFCY